MAARDIDGMVRWCQMQARTWEPWSSIWLAIDNWPTEKIGQLIEQSNATTNRGAVRVLFRAARTELGLGPRDGGIPGGDRS